MSLSALRNTTPGHRGNAGVEAPAQRAQEEGSWLRSVDRDRTDRTNLALTGTKTVALEAHWQASIEIATD